MTEQKKQTMKKDEHQPSAALATIEKTIADSVLRRVQTFSANKDIRLPANYSPENALKSAWLILLETKDRSDKPVLEVCTKESIANALLNMVLQGLNPVKKQCDFIAYGNKLTLQREYHGTMALARRYGGIREAVGNVVFEGDEFEYSIDSRGYKKVTKHIQTIDNIDANKIKGAYATLLFEDAEREPFVEIMTMAQIRQAWMQGATKGGSPAHKNFPDQMAIKTVISRACKTFISSSDDSALFDDDDTTDAVARASRERITSDANQEEITIDAQDAVEVKDTGGNGKEDPTPQNEPDPQPKETLFEEQPQMQGPNF
jgi:recombination protein RecT